MLRRQSGEGARHPSRNAQNGGMRVNECRMGTWNVRGGMNDKFNELLQVMYEMKMDVLCVTETKRKGSEIVDLPKGGTAIWSGVPQDQRACQGVGVLLSERLVCCMKDYCMVSPRLIWIRLKIKLTKFFLVAAYAPPNSTFQQDLDQFWDSVREVLDMADENERIILCGDLNGWVGTRRQGYEEVLGEYGDSRMNEAGKIILDVCLEKNLLVTNTLFPHKDIHTYTRVMNDERSMLDLMIVDRRLRRHITDTRAYRGPELGTDHYLVITRFSDLFRGWRHRQDKRSETCERIKGEKLLDENVRIDYVSNIEKNLVNLEDVKDNVDECWKLLRNSMVESASKVCGLRKKRALNGDAWWDAEVKASVEKKKKAWLSYIASLGLTENIRREKRKIFLRCKSDTKALVKEKKKRCREIGEEKLSNNFYDNSKLFWREVRNARSCSPTFRIDRIKSKLGITLTNTDEVLERWSEYFGDMYADSFYDVINDLDPPNQSIMTHGIQDEITVQEIEWAIRSLKGGKAAGIDRILPEMIKFAGSKLWGAFHLLCNICWQTGSVPKDWRSAVIVPLYKGKGTRLDCTNFRAISLISLGSKVYGKILTRRIIEKTESLLWEAQGGFRPGRGCTDQVFSLRNIIEKFLALNQKVFCAFMDLEKAFDRVVRKELWDILPEYGIDGNLLRAVQSLYKDCTASVRIDNTFSPEFNVNIGVKQGCVLSPRLFIIYLDKCLQRLKDSECGIRMGDKLINTLLYADDAVLIASSMAELQSLVTDMKEGCSERGLHINAKKSKVLVFERNDVSSATIMVDNIKLEQVNEFIYLGSVFTMDGRYKKDIERRVNAGNSVNGALWSVIGSQKISAKARLAIHNAVLVPTLLYGSESWICQKTDESMVNAVEMRSLRRICGVKITDRIRNDAIRERVGLKDSVCMKMRKGMLRWFGHIERMSEERLTNQIYNSKVTGKRGRGRPRNTYFDQINKVLKEGFIKSLRNRRACMRRVMTVDEAKEVCRDRTKWHSVISAYPVREMA